MKKGITKVLAAVMTAALLVCGSIPAMAAEAEEVTISFGYWGDSGEDKAYADAIKGIESVLPGVTVELVKYPSTNEFWANLPGQVAAGTAPDFIAPTNEGHMSYIVEGLFLPLNDYIDKYGFDLSDTLPNALEAWTYQDQIYAIPTTAAPGIFVVNKDMWDAAGLGELPTTWDEVYEAAKVLTTDDVAGICIDFSQGYHPTQYTNSFGGGWSNGETINSPENVAALEYILKMYEEGLAVNPKDLGLSWDGEVFAAGKCAMTTAGAWYVGLMSESAPDINYEVMAVPGGNGHQGSSMHATGFAVLSTSKNPEVAAQVANYMASVSAQMNMSTRAGYIPALESLQDWYYDINPKMAPSRASTEFAVSFGYPVQSTEFQTDLVRAFEEVYYAGADTTAQEILNTLAEKYSN
ncbi:MAG: sugar ABC transporter substrate-binding protein [Clostridiales bacterium]|jgi:multiple sugar transport system substrate-binding protein|nr:sugar ABC transporter substrate-binding protein [Clostridiales bacterium]